MVTLLDIYFAHASCEGLKGMHCCLALLADLITSQCHSSALEIHSSRVDESDLDTVQH